MLPRFVVLTPVLDDWESLARLIADIDRTTRDAPFVLELLVVDDGSAGAPHAPDLTPPDDPASRLARVEILRLALNLGHQRAIAVGLSAIAGRTDIQGVIVMDGDGEDRPDDIARLIAEAGRRDGAVIFAGRAQRSEGPIFRACYRLYKAIFRVLTGKEISFGNFSFLPMAAVTRLVHMPDLWNNLPAAIVRSRLRYHAIDTIRGTRYAGASHMNLPSLVVHGLSAMAVYTDIMFVRVVLGAALVSVLSVLAMVGVVILRLATSMAIPGWATLVLGDLAIVLALALVIVISMTFMVLSGRTARPFVPIADTGVFVAERIVIADRNLER
jgi:hypothetical protein